MTGLASVTWNKRWRTYVTYESPTEVWELRRLLKLQDPKFTVRDMTPRVPTARDRIVELEHEQLRRHPEVLEAIASCG